MYKDFGKGHYQRIVTISIWEMKDKLVKIGILSAFYDLFIAWIVCNDFYVRFLLSKDNSTIKWVSGYRAIDLDYRGREFETTEGLFHFVNVGPRLFNEHVFTYNFWLNDPISLKSNIPLLEWQIDMW